MRTWRPTVLVSILSCLFVTRTAQAITFTPLGPFPSGPERASGIAVGDFDEDGRPDIAVGSYFDRTYVLWGDGAGGFDGPQDWTSGNPLAAATDFDGDGHLDLVTWDGASLQVFWGTGTRTLGDHQVLGTSMPGSSAAVVDIDEDGDADLVESEQSDDQVEVFYNDGGRIFHSALFPAGPGPSGVAVGQLDGRNGLDMAVTGFWTSVVTLLFGNGAGGFGAPVILPGGVLPSGIVTGEFTGDGTPDIFYARRGCFADSETACSNDGVTILAGDGAGGFTPWVDLDAGEGPTGVVEGDLDGDGRDDVVVTNFNSNSISVFLGQFAGGMDPQPPIPVDRGPSGMVLADVNKDGCLDIVTANWRARSVSVVLVSGCTPPTPCGNGNLDPGEDCDDGALNGSPNGCCDVDCHATRIGLACADDGDGCTDDVCDATGTCTHPPSPDGDGDTVCDVADNCPAVLNPDQADRDGDGIGDVCDPFPDDPDNEQAMCEADLAQCTTELAECQVDLGATDAALDQCREDLALATLDTDGDGIRDTADQCPGTLPGAAVDLLGCSLAQFCAATDATTLIGKFRCRNADWKNDEPLMKVPVEGNCQIDLGGPGAADDRCVADSG